MLHVIAAALSLVVLGGCAQMPPGAGSPAPSQHQVGEEPLILSASPVGAPDPEADLLFSLLAGELAVQAGDYDLASEYYVTAARLSSDVAVAERATRVGVFARQYGRALVGAQRWNEIEPDNLDALQLLAVLLVSEGHASAAAERLRELVERVGPDEGYRLAASLLGQSDNGEVALDVMQRLNRWNPGELAAWQAHAELAYRLEDHDRARSVALAGLQRFPEALALRLVLAQALAELGDNEAALSAFAAIVDAHPDRQELRFAYARALMGLGDFDRVRPEFDRMLALAPDDSDLLLSIALLSLEAGRFALAREYLERLLASGRRVNDARYYLGRLHEQAGERRRAIRSYAAVGPGEHFRDASLRRAMLTAELEGWDAARGLFLGMQEGFDEQLALRAYIAEAGFLRDNRVYPEALERLARGLIQFPGSIELLYARGLVHERADDVPAALADFRAILDQEPDNVAAMNALGYTLADRTERYEEAYALIVGAYEQRPDDAAIIDSYGWVLYRLGRIEEALVHLRRAYGLLEDGEIASNLAVVLWEIGERDEAAAILDEALQREPDHERLLRVRRELLGR